MDIPYFFGAAAGGFVLMAAVGIQALAALFASLPLAKRRRKENPGFDLHKAKRRIVQVTVLTTAAVVVISILVVHFAPAAATAGYIFGLVLAFIMSFKRMSPNNDQNIQNFDRSYADCFPAAAVNPDDVQPPEQPEN